MCFRLTGQKLISLAIALLLQRYLPLATAQDVERLYYLQLQPLDITSLGAKYSEDLLAQFYGNGEGVYVKEQVLKGDSVGLIDIGNPFATPSNSRLFEETVDSDAEVEVDVEAELEAEAGFPVDLSDDLAEEEEEPSIQFEPTERDFYTVRKHLKTGGKFTVEFDGSGHVLGQWPISGLPYAWLAGEDEWRKDMRLNEPVFIENEKGGLRMEGMNGWDNFACQLRTHPAVPSHFWELMSIQRVLWTTTKIPRVTGPNQSCILVTITAVEATTKRQLQNTKMAIESVVETAVENVFEMVLENAVETNPVEGEVAITHDPNQDSSGDDVFGELNAGDAGDAIGEAIHLNIEEDDDDDELYEGQVDMLLLRRPGSRLFSQDTPPGEGESPSMQIEEEVEEEEEAVTSAGPNKNSEQADNSQQDENDILFFPEDIGAWTLEGGEDNETGEWTRWTGAPRGYSAQDLGFKREPAGLWGTRGSRSEDVMMSGDNIK
ncbi:hypothetical protein TWF694_001170 [Orbilia ellipsospora]|uniref:Uncharacterized protein n=1 Tax=Orbilia ellipsospora TaxID=2528407 RepID=A0AAV9XSP1_9PEZI